MKRYLLQLLATITIFISLPILLVDSNKEHLTENLYTKTKTINEFKKIR